MKILSVIIEWIPNAHPITPFLSLLIPHSPSVIETFLGVGALTPTPIQNLGCIEGLPI